MTLLYIISLCFTMEPFQKIILVVAIGLFVVCMIFIGIALSQVKDTQTWPPILSECPDYWVQDISGVCVNTHKLGSCPVTDTNLTMDFSTAPFTGSSGLCNKYKWATNCGLSWDGITYGVTNPCQQTESDTN
jgi:hypothetical protein